MVNKFWTTRDGKIGTAHLNRNGEEADFRPITRTNLDEMRNGKEKEYVIVVYPPSKQTSEPEPLKLSPRRIERIVTSKNVVEGTQYVKLVCQAEFQGLIVEAEKNLGQEWFDLEKKAAKEEALQKSSQNFRDLCQRATVFFEKISADDIIKFPFSSRDLGRLESGRLTISQLTEFAIRNLLTEFDEGGASLVGSKELHKKINALSTEELRSSILARVAEERRIKREAWLAKQA